MPWPEILAFVLLGWVLASFIIAWVIGRAISDRTAEYETSNLT